MALPELYQKLRHILETDLNPKTTASVFDVDRDTKDDDFDSLFKITPTKTDAKIPHIWREEIAKLALNPAYLQLLDDCCKVQPLESTDQIVMSSSSSSSSMPPTDPEIVDCAIEIKRLLACAAVIEAIIEKQQGLAINLEISTYDETITVTNGVKQKSTLELFLDKLQYINSLYEKLCHSDNRNARTMANLFLSPILTSYNILLKKHCGIEESLYNNEEIKINCVLNMHVFRASSASHFKDMSAKNNGNANYYKLLALVMMPQMAVEFNTIENDNLLFCVREFLSSQLYQSAPALYVDILGRMLNALISQSNQQIRSEGLCVADMAMLILIHLKINQPDLCINNQARWLELIKQLTPNMARYTEDVNPILKNLFIIAFHDIVKESDECFSQIKRAIYFDLCHGLKPDEKQDLTLAFFKLALSKVIKVGFDAIYNLLITNEKSILLTNDFLSRLGVNEIRLKKLVEAPAIATTTHSFLECLRSIDITGIKPYNIEEVLQELYTAYEKFVMSGGDYQGADAITGILQRSLEGNLLVSDLIKLKNIIAIAFPTLHEEFDIVMEEKGLSLDPEFHHAVTASLEQSIYALTMHYKESACKILPITAMPLGKLLFGRLYVGQEGGHLFYEVRDPHDEENKLHVSLPIQWHGDVDNDSLMCVREKIEAYALRNGHIETMAVIQDRISLGPQAQYISLLTQPFISHFDEKMNVDKRLLTYYHVYQCIDKLSIALELLSALYDHIVSIDSKAALLKIKNKLIAPWLFEVVSWQDIFKDIFELQKKEYLGEFLKIILGICAICNIKTDESNIYKNLAHVWSRVVINIDDFNNQDGGKRVAQIIDIILRSVDLARRDFNSDAEYETTLKTFTAMITYHLKNQIVIDRIGALINNGAIPISKMLSEMVKSVKDYELHAAILEGHTTIDHVSSLAPILTSMMNQLVDSVTSQESLMTQDREVSKLFLNNGFKSGLRVLLDKHMEALIAALPMGMDFNELKYSVISRFKQISVKLPRLVKRFTEEPLGKPNEILQASNTATSSIIPDDKANSDNLGDLLTFPPEESPHEQSLSSSDTLTSPSEVLPVSSSDCSTSTALSAPPLQVTLEGPGLYSDYLGWLTEVITPTNSRQRSPTMISSSSSSHIPTLMSESSSVGDFHIISNASNSTLLDTQQALIPRSRSSTSVAQSDSTQKSETPTAMQLITNISPADTKTWETLDKWLTTLRTLCTRAGAMKIVIELASTHTKKIAEQQFPQPQDATKVVDYSKRLVAHYVRHLESLYPLMGEDSISQRVCEFFLDTLKPMVSAEQSALPSSSASVSGPMPTSSSSSSSSRTIDKQTSSSSFSFGWLSDMFKPSPPTPAGRSAQPSRSQSQPTVNRPPLPPGGRGQG